MDEKESTEVPKPTPKNVAEIINERLRRKSSHLPYHVAKSLSTINMESEATNSTENLFYDNGSAPSNPTERRQLLQQLDTSFIASDESKVNTTQDTNILASSEELSDTGSEPTLFTKIVRCAKKALLETKNLKDKASNKETPEDQIIECAKTTAKCTIELIELIKSQIPKDDKDRNLQQTQLLESATKVKTNVLAFIPAARSFNSNPYDFLSKQQLNNSGSEVVSAIREMLSVAESLKNNGDSKNDDNLKKNSVFLIEVSGKINSALKELVLSVDSTTTISLSDLISNVAQEATHFISTATKQSDSSMETRIKETLLNLAVAARSCFKNKTDTVVRQQFKKNIDDLTAILRDFLSKYCGRYIQGNTELISVPTFDVNPPPSLVPPIPNTTNTSNTSSSSTTTTTPAVPSTKTPAAGSNTQQTNTTGIVRAAIPGSGTPVRTERTKTLASQRIPVPSKDFINKLESSLHKQPPTTTAASSNDNNETNMPTTISKASIGSSSTGSLPIKSATESNSNNSVDSISSISDALIHLLQDRYKSFANDWKNQNTLYNNETNRLASNLVQKQTQNQIVSGKEDPIVSDLIKLLTSKSNNREWEDVEKELKAFTRNITQRLRKDYFFTSNANNSSGNMSLSVEEQMCECSANLGELLIDLLLCLHDLICKATASNISSPSTPSKSQQNNGNNNNRTEDLSVYIEKFKALLKRCVELSREWVLTDKLKTTGGTINRSNSVVSRSSISAPPSANDKELDLLMNVVETNLNSITNLSTRGKLNQTIINAITDSQTTGLSNYFSTKLKLEETLTNSLSNDSYSIRVLAIQLMTALTSLASLSNRSDFMIIYQIIGICKVTVSKLENILNNFETLIYIINTESINEKSMSKLRKSLQSDNNDVNIWSSDKYSIVRSNQNGSFLGGTINHIVLHLTSEQDSKFLATFIIMYKSFTTPNMLLEKLQQRYTIPKEVKLSEADSARIKFRVCVVLQEWIKNQFDDFDKELIEKVKQFIYELEKDGKKVIADRLIKEIQNKIKDREKYKNSILDVDPWIQLKIPEGGFSPVSFIMGSTDAEIARQFTMIEFQIFHKIQSSEFLNLSWNTPKLQHKSPNVLDLISRANQLSYWVASLIIWSNKLNDRVNVILKCIQIAQHLLQLSNFNTLMSFIAGLNISAVSRLKLTWAAVEKNHPAAMENLRRIQATFDPSNSNKTYRKAHNDATSMGPCLPYLAVFLSDLTFSEEGNPDTLENSPFLINYAKREIICSIIRKIQLNQHPPYQFPLVEPLNTFLSELPFYTEKDLYDLSLLREPRMPEASTSTSTLR